MNRQYSISIDIGTTNTKVSLYHIGNCSVERRGKFKTSKFTDKYGELFDIDSIYREIEKLLIMFIKEFPNKIDSINIASVGEVGVLLTSNFERATDAIAWYDTRSNKFIKGLTEEEKEKIYKITGLPAHTNYVVSKIKWLYEYRKVNTTDQYIWANISDYIAYLLTGNLRTEYTLACRTMCFDIRKKSWSNEILDIFGIRNFVTFPKVLLSGETIGYTNFSGSKNIAKESIAIKIAGHDHIVGADGIGLQENELLNSTGTTEGLLGINNSSHINYEHYKNKLSSGVYVNPDFYTLFSSLPTGGIAFEWFQQLFNMDFNTFSEISDELYRDYINGNIDLQECLTIIPHLNGSGPPFKNSLSKGLIYGITTDTDQKDLLLGIFVGLSMEMTYVSKSFPMNNIDRIVVIGPAVKNKLWLQLKADFLNKNIVSVNTDEAVSLGALRTSYKYQYVKKNEAKVIKPLPRNTRKVKDMMKDYEVFYKTKKEVLLGEEDKNYKLTK